MSANATANAAKKPARTAPPPSLAQQADMMERLLRAQLEGWRRVVTATESQREAVLAADGAALERIALEQQQVARTLSTLDLQRERLANGMQKVIAPKSAAMLPLTNILRAAAVDDEQRERLASIAGELRTTIETAKRRSSIVRDAAETLSKHIAGIQQTVHSALSRARVYGRRGKLALGSATPAAVDIKS
jgi:hypothetical protein